MKLTLVAAVAKNGVIGKADALPWYIPEDLKHFKEVTTGKACLMGRNTFDSIMTRLGKPLPNRESIVITRHEDWKAPDGVKIYHSLEDALEYLKDHSEVMVIGGGQVYKQTIDIADQLLITHVDQDIDGDVFFPEIDQNKWIKSAEEKKEGFSWVTYERKR